MVSEDSERTALDKAKELQERTKRSALRTIRLFRALPRQEEARIIGRQLLRAATSVAANYRAACRARSSAEFAAKIGLVVEEADEAVFWLELLVEAEIVPLERMEDLIDEANELLAIFSASRRTTRTRNQYPNPPVSQSLNLSIPQSLNPSIPQSLNRSISQSLNLSIVLPLDIHPARGIL